MNEHSFRVLEFDKLKQEIAEFCFLEETQEKILELNPFNDINLLKRELEITRDFIELVKYDGGLELEGLKNIGLFLKKIDLIGTYLDPEEVYYLKENLKIFRKASTKLEELVGKYRALYLKFKSIPTYKGIEELINKAVDKDKKIRDDASLELKDIRHQKLILSSNIKKKFDEIMSNQTYTNAIQEKIVTVRDGRSVIPIKSDFKGQIKGIEHDRSSSGQTVFIEPLAVVSLNNKMRELEVREREEIRKILLRLTDYVRTNLDGIQQVAAAILELDFLNSKANYAVEKNCTIPDINSREYISLVEARHPFIPPKDVVPLTFEIGKAYNTLLITGPNTGGKTVALKTAGLLSLMALSGVPVPAAEKTSIGFFTGVYADIGDEQSIEQNLSSFSAHLKNVQKILESVNRSSLVLLDELGSGTDPMEGSAFAMAVIDYLKDKKCRSFISTHYSEVKAHGYNEEGIETASMEFNSETLSPTYRLLMGIPGESNALTIAKRLGVSDEIVENAKKYISEENKKVESMIGNIKEKSDELEKTKIEMDTLKKEASNLRDEYEEKLRVMEKEKQEIIKKAYEEADKLVREAQSKARALVEKIQKEEHKKQEAKEIQKSLNMLRTSIIEEKSKKVHEKPKMIRKIEFKEGEKVFVKSLNQHATILRIVAAKDSAQVQAGILKLVVSLDDLKKVDETTKKKFVTVHAHKKSSVKSEIDLRGKMLDEAIHELESYLDKAVLNGYTDVYIIHGKGTGVLRKGIQEYLKNCGYVREYRDANQNEGGLGCTVATLK
jgi:DNA mismatch repair protein MutS2